ncbi:MAG: serine hydrolase domain-containing protein [Gemmatimonadaceae bacterium]
MKPVCAYVRLALGAISLTAVPADAQSAGRIPAAIDSVVASYLKDGKAAGMSVAVLRGNDTLVLKGYGFADLELDVTTPAAAVYEIGSVTKQFTAAAMLLLAQDGKLSLEDDLTKYLPDYPTHGRAMPLGRLLDHTSGIKGYTEIPRFGALMTRKLPKDSLVALFKDEPLDFPTGTALIYSNSAYFLAGLVIEKVAGMPYGEFVEKRLFAPLGMHDSHYCNERKIVKRRAHGYDTGPGAQLVLKGYIDHTYPYAAGSLCSTAGDLLAWMRALHGNRVLSERAYRSLITPDTLTDGTPVRYAKGLAVSEIAGHRAISHGGGINGYLSETAWLPEAQLAVVVLINTAGPVAPAEVAASLVEVILGRRKAESQATPFTGDLAAYTGTFEGPGRGRRLRVTFAADSGHLTARIADSRTAARVEYVGANTFARGSDRYVFTFVGGRAERVRVDRVALNTTLMRQ